MPRLLPILLLILMAFPLSAPPTQASCDGGPCNDTIVRLLMPVLASASPAGLTVAWSPPANQRLACVYRRAPLPVEVLGCLRGAQGVLRLPRGGDVGLQAGLGDVVEVRAYGDGGVELARGRTTIAWRVWLAQVGQ